MITVSVTGINAVQQTMARLVPASERTIIELAERIHKLAVDGAEKHRKTGALVDSFGHGPRRIPGGWEIGANAQRAPHAAFVHWGTRPHDIRPKEGGTYTSYKDASGKTTRKGIKKGGRDRKMLRWTSGGGFIFAKFVHHPGYKGDPFLSNAANQAIREFPQMVERSMKGI